LKQGEVTEEVTEVVTEVVMGEVMEVEVVVALSLVEVLNQEEVPSPEAPLSLEGVNLLTIATLRKQVVGVQTLLKVVLLAPTQRYPQKRPQKLTLKPM
jgi:hypothetical protein